jgi:hypothetical protein
MSKPGSIPDPGGSSALNRDQYENEVRRLAEDFAELSVPPDKAIAEASRIVREQLAVVNGVYTSTMADGMTDDLRKSIPTLGSLIAAEYAAKYGRSGQDYTLQLNPVNQLWQVRDKTLRTPVPDPKGEFTFTTQELLARQRADDAARIEKTKKAMTMPLRTRIAIENQELLKGQIAP